MENRIYDERNGLWYAKQGDYYLPKKKSPQEYADKQGVTEQLKAENQLEWVGKMNNIRSRAVEIIDVELICVQGDKAADISSCVRTHIDV